MLAATVAVLTSRDRPVVRALAYLVGAAVTIAIIGTVAVAAGGTVQDGGARKPTTASRVIDFGLGAALLYLAARRAVGDVKRRRGAGPGSKAAPESRHLRSVGSELQSPPRGTITLLLRNAAVGVVIVVTDFSSLVPYFAAAKVTADAHVGVADEAVAMGFVSLFVLLPIIVPIVIRLVMPATSTRILTIVSRFVKQHTDPIAIVILVVFGAYLIAKGTGIL